ncbi:DUF1648 domain-containing protein [Chloroflexota bacterium]
MTVFILIIVAVILIGLGCGTATWFIYRYRRQAKRKKPTGEVVTGEMFSFRWRYIMLPLAFLPLSVILLAIFYPRLPAEVAYHFTVSGSPDRWLSREILAVWMLAPQLLLTLLAGGIAWGVAKIGTIFSQADGSGIKPQSIMWLMGNMVALPQIVICFAMLDIFSYNAYQIHLMPVWIFALIIMGLGGIVLGVFLIRTVMRAWGTIGQQ